MQQKAVNFVVITLSCMALFESSLFCTARHASTCSVTRGSGLWCIALRGSLRLRMRWGQNRHAEARGLLPEAYRKCSGESKCLKIGVCEACGRVVGSLKSVNPVVAKEVAASRLSAPSDPLVDLKNSFLLAIVRFIKILFSLLVTRSLPRSGRHRCSCMLREGYCTFWISGAGSLWHRSQK